MISYVKGELTEISYESIVVEAGGIGYNIIITGMDYPNLPACGSEIKIYTYFSVHEDSMSLYGFLDKDSKAMFELLLTVNGIGPKAAISILSALTMDDLRFAILSQDSKAISKAPGIGSKTAQRILLELKDKVNLEEAFEKKAENVAEAGGSLMADSQMKEDAVNALVALGYSSTESLKAVSKVKITDAMTVDDLLRETLKSLAML